jgi:hypothetical protein
LLRNLLNHRGTVAAQPPQPPGGVGVSRFSEGSGYGDGMAKYLLLGNSDDSWTLPADTDNDELMERLKEAFDGADVAEVAVEMTGQPGQRLTIVVNPEAIGWWSIYEDDK